jgi:hypothetical protein
MDLKYNNYSKDAKVISLALQDNTKFTRTLYLENYDYLLTDNTGWVPGDNAAKNRILNYGIPKFWDNVSAFYTAKANFVAKINEYLGNYTKVQIMTYDPLSWILFVDLFGDIEDLPNVIDPIPTFLPSVFLSKGLALNTNVELYNGDNSFSPVDYNSLYEVIKYRKAYNKLLNLLSDY